MNRFAILRAAKRCFCPAQLSAVIILTLCATAAHADDDQPIIPAAVNPGRPVEFQRDIYPIFAGSCVACHNRSKSESDLILETAQSAIQGGSSGEAVIAGSPDDSYLYQVAARSEEPHMPPLPNDVQARALTPEQLGLLRQWILEGATTADSNSGGEIAWQEMNSGLHAVYSIAADPFGRYVAAGRANTVTVYDLKVPAASGVLADPQLPSLNTTHRDYAHAIAFHPSGELIATAGYQVIKLWKRKDSQPEFSQPLPAIDLNVSGNGQLLIKFSETGVAQLWNASEDRLVAELTRDLLRERLLMQLEAARASKEARAKVVKSQIAENKKRVDEQKAALTTATEKQSTAIEAVSAAETKLAEATTVLAEPGRQLEADPDNEELKKQVAEFSKALEAAAKTVANARNGSESALRGVDLAQQAVARAEQRLQARQEMLADSETELQTAAAARDQTRDAAVAIDDAVAAAFVPKSSLVATIEQSGRVRLWSTTDGTPIDVLSFAAPLEGAIASAFTDGQVLSVLMNDESRLNVELFPAWQPVGVLGGSADSVFIDRVLALAFSPDGARLAAGGGEASRSGQLTIWSTADWTLEREIANAHSDTIYGLEFSGDGRLLASAAADKFVKVFDVTSGDHVRSYEGHTHHVMDVSWNADRTSLVSAGADNMLKVWDAETGEQRRTISTYNKQVTSVQYVGLQDEFLSSSGDHRVFLHRAGDGATVREFPGNKDYVYCSAVTPDGTLVVAGGEDGVVRVWNGTDAKSITTFAPE